MFDRTWERTEVRREGRKNDVGLQTRREVGIKEQGANPR